ncbi:MAG: addiction module toxin, HicA family [Bdellovibrionales bacterium RIFOXYD1_FULL_53_11]|nr:MAG: addiction module toxin, HicA family [Bdellovibrionales bacterium RIFOXYD1_FULL_53_11]
MKLYKVREILRVLKNDGWVLLRQKGSHQQFAHPTKKGLVTVSFHSSNDDLHPRIAKSIFNQAGLKEDK